MNLGELKKKVEEALEVYPEGTPVEVDTDAAKFMCHLVDINRISIEDPMLVMETDCPAVCIHLDDSAKMF